jgi:hypothetical protein
MSARLDGVNLRLDGLNARLDTHMNQRHAG